MSLKRSLATPYAREVRARLDDCLLQPTWQPVNIPSQGSSVPPYRTGSSTSGNGALFKAASQPASTSTCAISGSQQTHGRAQPVSVAKENYSATYDIANLGCAQDPADLACPICNDIIGGLSESERQQHTNKCLDESCRDPSNTTTDQSSSSSSNGLTGVDCGAMKKKKRPIVRGAKAAPPKEFILDLSQHDDDFVPRKVTKISKISTRVNEMKATASKQDVKRAPIFSKKNASPQQPKNEKSSLRQEISSLDSQIAELQAKRGRLITKLKKLDLAQAAANKKRKLIGRELRPVRIVLELVFGFRGGAKVMNAINHGRHCSRSRGCPLWDASKQILGPECVYSPPETIKNVPHADDSSTVDQAERAQIAEFLLTEENNNCSNTLVNKDEA